MKLRAPVVPSDRQAILPVLSDVEAWVGAWQRDNRILLLFDEVGSGDGKKDEAIVFSNKTTISDLIAAFLYFDSVSADPITLFINSPGGEIISGLALIQTMRDLESPVHTVVLGEAASMAAVIAVAGDKRFAYPHARWLLHRGKGEARGDADDIGIAAKELKILDGYADYLVVQQTKIPAERLKRMQAKDKWMGTPEALKWGLIDEITTPRKGPANWIPDKAFLKSLREKEEEEDREREGES